MEPKLITEPNFLQLDLKLNWWGHLSTQYQALQAPSRGSTTSYLLLASDSMRVNITNNVTLPAVDEGLLPLCAARSGVLLVHPYFCNAANAMPLGCRSGSTARGDSCAHTLTPR